MNNRNWEIEFDERDRNATHEIDAPLLQLTNEQRAWFKSFIKSLLDAERERLTGHLMEDVQKGAERLAKEISDPYPFPIGMEYADFISLADLDTVIEKIKNK